MYGYIGNVLGIIFFLFYYPYILNDLEILFYLRNIIDLDYISIHTIKHYHY